MRRAANANGTGADIITFNAGINPTLTIVSGGATENDAATGDLDINSSVTITGNNPTTISTGYTSGCGDCKVFGIDQTGAFPGVAVSFSGVTVQNGAGLALAGNATVNALTLGAAGGDTTTLRVNTGSGVNSLGVLTANALVSNGTVTVDVGTVGLSTGIYPVLDYAGTIGGAGFGASRSARFHHASSPTRSQRRQHLDRLQRLRSTPRWTGPSTAPGTSAPSPRRAERRTGRKSPVTTPPSTSRRPFPATRLSR
jgi:hypothetical protein